MAMSEEQEQDLNENIDEIAEEIEMLKEIIYPTVCTYL